ncbi:MAG: membrane protein insertase YidC [Gammaproteobacteria bacterium]|nr:MAG: membrane protein insertase YidC [Gammaproteobacteria bacterium]
MEALRFILFLALAIVSVLIYEAWQEDNATPEVNVTASAPQAPQAAQQQTSQQNAEVPGTPENTATQPSDAPAALSVEAATDAPRGKRVRVRTDVYDLQIDTIGGDIRILELSQYPIEVGKPENYFRLLNDTTKDFFVSQMGLLGDAEPPNHHASFTTVKLDYRLEEGRDELKVPLHWQGNGLSITKVYTFRRGLYQIDIDYEIKNGSGSTWQGRVYRQLQRSRPSEVSRFLYTYTGGVISSEENPYEKIDFDDMDEEAISQDFTGGWVAMIQHYFIGAILGGKDELNHYFSKALPNGRYVIGNVSPRLNIENGATGTLHSSMFIGPKIQEVMEKAAPNLELTVDFGWLTFLAKPVFWLLDWFHGFLGNWGWAIIFTTIVIKLLFYKLSEASYRSMARMKKISPRMQQLKERFGDDKKKMNQALMDLYKREKINPLGGCLPILIQIPVFIALYWTLLESVELRQASFIFWWNDLSSPDPFFVLPIIMGITMVLQQKLNPTPMDPTQAKVMMVLPIVFTVFFLFFPSGLVLYWVVNNTLSILQQWVINKRLGATD